MNHDSRICEIDSRYLPKLSTRSSGKAQFFSLARKRNLKPLALNLHTDAEEIYRASDQVEGGKLSGSISVLEDHK